MKGITKPLIAAIALTASTMAAASSPASMQQRIAPDHQSPIGVPMDAVEMQLNQGKFVFLPWIFGITSLDLALIGVYWGVYVPNYGLEGDYIAELGDNRVGRK